MGQVRALLCGYYGFGNGGDEALLLSLLQMLPKTVEPIVLSGNPSQTTKDYQVESCDRKNAFALVNALKRSDYFIWGGGSLMQDVTSFYSPLYYGGLMALAQRQGLKTIAWSQGIGPLRRSWNRWLTKEVLLGSVGVSVRDHESAKLLDSWGLEPILAPDPVWALESSADVEIEHQQKPCVAVTLRPHPQLTSKILEALVCGLKQFQAETDCFLLLLPFQVSQDKAITRYVLSQLDRNCQLLSLTDPRQLKGIFQTVDFAIGMRYHSLIMAMSHQCPCFALSYDPKITHLMRAFQLPGWKLEDIPEEPQMIADRWLQAYQSPQTLDAVTQQKTLNQALRHQELLIKLCL